jgi:predicted dehydrogenase
VRAKAGAAELAGEQKIYGTVEEMLEGVKLDAAVITSPDFQHADNAVAALNRGVNVLIDKPLATTVEGCERVIKAAEKAGKIALMGFNLRHSPALKRLKEIVDQGTLGRVFLIENREFYDGGRTYMSRWNGKYEYSGGLWIHKGSHDFDIFNWLLGFPKAKCVSATAGINVFTPDNIPFELNDGVPVGPTCADCAYKNKCPDMYDVPGDAWGKEANAVDGYSKDLCMYTSEKSVHDNGIAIVEYENGARASHMECFVTSRSDRLYTVVGDKGQAEVSLHDRTILIRPRWTQETILHQIPEVSGGHGGADTFLVESFIDVIKGVRPATSTLEHGLLSTAIGQAAELASREHRTVFLNELISK